MPSSGLDVAASTPLTIEAAAAALRRGELTSVELTERLLARADRLDARLGSYLARFDETALEAAAAADQELVAGHERGPLCGIPMAVKDLLAAQEGPTTAQSTLLDPGWGAGRDATVVRSLRDAGAVIVGKTTTMEYACGSPEEGSPFPLPRNPWDLDTWAGGSSSGSGNGVAAGLFLAAIGTDTGGSIRIPAAFNGVTGIAPTFGLVSKAGCVPVGYSLDRVGPLARSAWDCACVLDAVAGHDPCDPDSAPRPGVAYADALAQPLEGLRVGIHRQHLDQGADADVVAAFERATAVLAELGCELIDVTIPLYDEMQAAAMVINSAEAFAYHRNDLRDRWDEYVPFGRTLLAGGALLSAGDVVQADRVRRAAIRRLREVFARVDVIVGPTTTRPAPTFDTTFEVGLMGIFDRIHTTYWNGAGAPVVAAPIGFTTRRLPVSMQIAAAPFADADALRLAHAYQQHTDWHLQVPSLEPAA
jgi:aspartyl-tRNA(Asn)/glutamyl-tRNA(Gln) amidotransferase subunit A